MTDGTSIRVTAAQVRIYQLKPVAPRQNITDASPVAVT